MAGVGQDGLGPQGPGAVGSEAERLVDGRLGAGVGRGITSEAGRLDVQHAQVGPADDIVRASLERGVLGLDLGPQLVAGRR